MGHENTLIAGWYGKTPSIGDFISRRLPSHFIETWDTWLQRSIIVSREQLKERWLDSYLTGPIWHFVLMPGICGNHIWTGIMMPSVDNVGRYFPLTFALQVEPCTKSMLTAFSAETWHTNLEAIALSSLDINVFPDYIDQSLNNLVFPNQDSNTELTTTNELAAWWQAKSRSELDNNKVLSLPTENTIIEHINFAAAELLFAYGSNKSVWWRIAPGTEKTRTNYYIGLPPENHFATLLVSDLFKEPG